MCDPITIGAIGVGINLIGGVRNAQAERAAGAYQQQTANRNAAIEDMQVADALSRGAIEEDRQRQRTRQRIGSQRAALAANFLDLGAGTAVDLVSETAAFGEQDALTIRSNAAREAWGHRVQAGNYRQEGKMARAAGKNAARGTLLTSFSNAFSSGYGLSKG